MTVCKHQGMKLLNIGQPRRNFDNAQRGKIFIRRKVFYKERIFIRRGPQLLNQMLAAPVDDSNFAKYLRQEPS